MRAVTVALLLVLTLARAAQGESSLPQYPGAPLTRIGSDLVVSGELYRIGYFTTRDAPGQVGQYFHHLWHREGVPTTIDGDFREAGVVSGFYTREGLQRSVVVRKSGAQTVAFSVVRDLWVTAPDSPASKPPLQLEGTLFAGSVAARGSQGGNWSLLVRGELGKTRDAVLAQMKTGGFTLVHQSEERVGGKQQVVFEHVRARERRLTTLGELDAGMTAILQVSPQGETARAPDGGVR